MSMRMVRNRVVLLLACVLVSSLSAAADAPRPSNKWRIECSGNAESEGVITFRVTPTQGGAIEVQANIAKGRGENEVARDIRDAFRAQLPTDRFTSETDDGEDVLVQRRSGQPDFVVELVQATTKGTRFNLQRE
jgi:hypothetical protein